MLEYMQDKATIEDVVKQLEDDQESVVNNKPEVFTTTTEDHFAGKLCKAGRQMFCTGNRQ